ncbi:MAG: type II toxin-antitoxin system prevent-host-death family antitoxin [Myxococcota bacterium]|nr:type II toxin-antitoxin system prevent-host-death family antitoxin [Myxococcota bacterium]
MLARLARPHVGGVHRGTDSNLSRLLDRAAGGEEIVITRNGRSVAKLLAATAAREPRQLGCSRAHPYQQDLRRPAAG